MVDKTDPAALLKSIYLGDRFCQGLVIDSNRSQVGIQINVISKLRPGTTTWDYYTDEDVVDGWLVFIGVAEISFDPPGHMPNDLVDEISVRTLDTTGLKKFEFALSIGSVDSTGTSTDVRIKIVADNVMLLSSSDSGYQLK